MKSLLFLSFSDILASRSLISCLVRFLEEVAVETRSRKLGVRVGGGSSCMILATVFRMGMTQISCTMATYFPTFSGIGDTEVVEILSGG